MNLKQLGILLVIVAIIGGAGLVLHRNQQSSWSGGSGEVGKKLLGELPVNDVAHIAITHGTNGLNLVKKEDEWRVRERHDYPANYPEISGFLLKARDLKVVQSEQVGPSQLSRLNLASGQGTNGPVIVELKDAGGKLIRTLLLGKKHLRKAGRSSPMGEGDEGWPDGRYVKVGADAGSVVVISDPLDSIEPKADQWLDKDFFRIEKVKSIAVVFPEATNSWKLARPTETDDWALTDPKPGEEVDSSKAGTASSAFGSASFTDVLPGGNVIGQESKSVAMTVETFDDFKYTIKAGQKKADDYPLTVSVEAHLPGERVPGKDEKPEEKARLDTEFKEKQKKLQDKLKQEQRCQKWTYLVPGWVVDPVLKPRFELLKTEVSTEGGKEQSLKVETHTPATPAN